MTSYIQKKLLSNTKKVNVAVIGTGHIGKHHARNYSELRQAHLAAVCDSQITVGKTIAKKFKCNFYADYTKMLRSEDIEAVSIAVPTKLHKKIAIDCIKRGKHVLIEKPIASTVNQAIEIINMAQKMGVILTVGHLERFNPAVRALKKLISDNKLGQIISIIAKRVGPSAPQIKDSGVLKDLAVHDIDILNYLLDRKPTKIYANGGKAMRKSQEDYAEIFLNYGSKTGYIQVNWLTPIGIRQLQITGTGGYAELNYITQELNLYQAKYKKQIDPQNYQEFLITYGAAKKITLPIKFQEPLKLELSAFLNSIQTNTPPEVTGEQALTALEIALKALKKSRHA